VLAGLVALVAVLAAPAPAAYALERRSSDAVIVSADQTVDDDVFAAGRLVRIDGTVRGDVYAFAQVVTVTAGGTIEGDLIAAAQQVIVDGQVRGNVRAAGATVQVNGGVGRNVTGAAQLLQLGTAGRVGGSWISAGETTALAGDVGGAFTAAGEDVILQGRIGRGAEAALRSLTLGPNARIGGDLTYYADHELNIPAQAVGGQVQFRQTDRAEAARERRGWPPQPLRALGNVFGLAWLVGSAIVGLALLRLFPRFVARFLEVLEARPLPSLGLGVLAMLATLPAAVLVALTLIGIPLAALLVAGYVGGIFFGWLLLAVGLGTILLGLLRRGRPGHHGWAFLLGLLVLYVATRIPVAGGLIGFAGAALGLGALLITLYRSWLASQAGAAALPA
jgi:cytoskeletal protein CcmA (bactofilin family)